MIQRASTNLETKILAAIVAPDEGTLAPALAKALLAFEFQPSQKVEIERLLNRNNAGTLTDRQKTKLEAYVRVGNFISLLKVKARASIVGDSK